MVAWAAWAAWTFKSTPQPSGFQSRTNQGAAARPRLLFCPGHVPGGDSFVPPASPLLQGHDRLGLSVLEMCIILHGEVAMERNSRKLIRLLKQDGWFLVDVAGD